MVFGKVMKFRTQTLLGGAAFILPIVLLVILVFFRASHRGENLQDFDVKYTNVVSEWGTKRFIPITPYDDVESRLASVGIVMGEVLSEEQYGRLTASILGWFKAYSSGSQEDYLAFRFPKGVPWDWKDGALQTLSNYFVNGIVFDSEELHDTWMRRYGHPDHIRTMVPYRNVDPPFSQEEMRDVRARWVAKYGDGSGSLKVSRPDDAFGQWLILANDHAGTNWWLDYWSGVSIEEMVVSISDFQAVPEPLHKYPFGMAHRRSTYDIDAEFPNMGVARMDRKSLIEWKSTYEDLLREQGHLLTANLYVMFRRSEQEFPQPALIRFVYVQDHAQWVPYDTTSSL